MSHIKDFIAELRIGAPQASGPLLMFPLLKDRPDQPDYLTLDEALANGTARVEEVGEAGSVPELLFRNDGEKPVLLLDGEELVGAKQNRVLNLSILAPAHAETKIPVSCVEAHRWGYRSRHFGSSDRAFYASGRAAKMAQVSASLATGRSRRSDQHAIWEDIAATSSRLRVQSDTGAMADIYEQRRAGVDGHVQRLAAQAGQVGALFAIGDRIVGLDLFDSSATYAKLAPKLVRSYALDAVDLEESTQDRRAAIADVEAFLQRLEAADAESFPAVGLGEDLRAKGDRIGAAALVHNGAAVHLCAFVA